MRDINAILEKLRFIDNRAAINDFMRLMADFIYVFPRIRRKERIVECGEYYEYAVSKLSDGSRLKSYDPKKGSFDVWFTKVLDNFLNTLVTAKIKEEEKFPLIDLDVDSIGIDESSKIDIISFEKGKQDLSDAYDTLNDTEKAVAICNILFYKDVSPGELSFLAEFTRKDIDTIRGEIENLLTGELQDECDRIKKESEKISSLQISIKNLESRLTEYQLQLESFSTDELRNRKRIEDLKGLIEKLEFNLWKKRTKYIHYSQIHRRGRGWVLLKNKKIAEFLNLKEGSVTSAVTRIRQKIRRLPN